ncbi:MAG TPA: ABC transporter permease subunit [Cyclobacteriaceae bacterium]|nr:ABC transporter permease [Cyclobacteriaceae bacterium]HNP06815.1 ABC transporter permease subunit [Cyclobacteriaceae bacterium]HRK54694.1 ABC transporter permease subunit [Cyclobacteriaceae bacterium]
MIKIAKYVLLDILRNKFVILYTFFLFLVTLSMFSLEGNSDKAILSLLNIILMVVPLVSIIFTTIHFFNSYEFIELLLSQPINRKSIFLSEFAAVSLALCLAYIVGVGVPVTLFSQGMDTVYLILSGVLLTLVFVALAFSASVLTRDKAKGIGLSLLFWFYFTLIYDGFVLYVIYAFSDYPLEKVTLALVSLNPVDLARIIILLKLDISALMGYTGAFYKQFFGSSVGIIYSFLLLLLWAALPMFIAMRKFLKKDI